MCLTIPHQVISVKKDQVIIKNDRRQQSLGTLVKVKKGDWVLTQNNVIISKITKNQAREIDNLLSS